MELTAWLALKSVPGIGNLLFKRLMDRFKHPSLVFEADDHDLQAVPGISGRIVRTLRRHTVPDHLLRDMEQALANGCRILVLTDPDYPCLLREIPDPPPYLFVKGTLPSLPAIAVVGSRSASHYGLTVAKKMAGDLVCSGAMVVSGLARGIDTAAHEGALDKNGKTVAVLGCGIGKIYPPENINLSRMISENGALVSELPFLCEPVAHNFPVRNRIISGMSLGTLVVEAAQKSGSLITARLAAEQNREVFAVPGSIHSFKSSGTHNLLKQGAKLVETVQDILEEIPRLSGQCFQEGNAGNEKSETPLDELKNKFNLDFNELSVLKVLDSYPVHIDDILQHVSMEPGMLSAVLLKLELMGMIHQLPGKLFSINEDIL